MCGGNNTVKHASAYECEWYTQRNKGTKNLHNLTNAAPGLKWRLLKYIQMY
jgi:hypothetical protein